MYMYVLTNVYMFKNYEQICINNFFIILWIKSLRAKYILVPIE